MDYGDLTIQPQASIGTAPYVGSTTHDVSVTGTQSITGVGFKPSAIHVYGYIGGGVVGRFSVGFSDASGPGETFMDNYAETANTWQKQPWVIAMRTASSVRGSAELTSMDSDGFTLTWSKNGSPTGICQFSYIAFK